jgi:GntR family transcriptional regulator
MILADETLATIFHVAMGTNLYCLKRIRGTETERIVYSETYLRPIVNIPTTTDVLFGSLYSFLISQGFYFHRFEESISARKVNDEIVEKLDLKETISLVRTRLGFDQHHQLIEYTINYYNPAYYEYRNIIESQKGVR